MPNILSAGAISRGLPDAGSHSQSGHRHIGCNILVHLRLLGGVGNVSDRQAPANVPCSSARAEGDDDQVHADRNRSTFAAAYSDHFDSLYRFAYLLFGSAEVAEDAVQDVFLNCAGRLPTLDHPRSYLRTSLINLSRRQHPRGELVNSLAADATFDSGTLPHDAIETRRALETLTERQRTAVVLRYFVDIPDERIAVEMDCAEATVRSLIRRALIKLRKELE